LRAGPVNGLISVGTQFLFLHLLVDFFENKQKGIINILIVKRRGFLKEEVIFACKLLRFLGSHFPCVFQVALVPNQHHHRSRISVLLQFLQPGLDVCKRLVLRHVVNQQGTSCVLIVSCSNSSKSLLPCCIPDLSFYYIAVLKRHFFRYKFGTNRSFALLEKFILIIPRYEVRFSHRSVADHYHLDNKRFLH